MTKSNKTRKTRKAQVVLSGEVGLFVPVPRELKSRIDAARGALKQEQAIVQMLEFALGKIESVQPGTPSTIIFK